MPEQRELERLRESEARYRSLVEAAREMICVVDLAGRFTSFNSAFETLTGWPREEWLGRPFAELVHPDDLPACQAAFEAGLRSPIGPIVRHRILKRDSGWLEVESTGTPYHREGRLVGVIGLVRDVSERRRAEEELERSRRLLEEADRIRRALLNRLIATHEAERARVSRELHDGTGQALAALLMGLRRIEDALSLKEARRVAARERALLVQAIDDLSRLARGLRPIVLDDMGLKAALERHASDQAWLFGFEVVVDAEALGERRLPGSLETALYRVVQEALANAARHAAPAHVRIALERDAGTVRLTVADDGCGFDVAGLPPGIGHLGLHGIRERAALVGGRAEVRSTRGAGTTVTVIVPVSGSARVRRKRPESGGAGRRPADS